MDEQMRDRLHGEIMNIRCVVPDHDGKPCDFALAYKLGHRDARHEAAELVTTATALSPPAAAGHPMQPIALDNKGTPRFKENAIVSYLTQGRLNELYTLDFNDEDWMQLTQLIGYSVSGWGGLSRTSDEAADAAGEIADRMLAKATP